MSAIVEQTMNSKFFITYPRLTQLHQSIQQCHELTQIFKDPQCMVLEGPPSVGKTKLVRAYASSFPPKETPEGIHIPVFYVLTPSPVTIKGLASTMLDQLGDPLYGKGTLERLNMRLIHYLKVCKIELVIIDDFHHLIDVKTDRVLNTVSDWLKFILRSTGIPFLVVGIEGQVQRILQWNVQLSRHFTTREVLSPFSCRTEIEINEFDVCIQAIEQALDVILSTEIPRREMIQKLYHATAGTLGHLMILLRFAATYAKAGETNIISLDILASTFDKHLSKHLELTINPFQNNSLLVNRPKIQFFNNDPSSIRKSRRRNKRNPDEDVIL